MASPVEENFIFNEIKKLELCDILEFGSGENKFPNNISSLGHDVTAIDLYDRKPETNYNIKFIKDDFINVKFPSNIYDCVYALSSFEHIGLENNEILPIDEMLNKIKYITEKISRILKNDGLFLVTLPFGDYKYYYCGPEGWSYDKNNDSVSGAKVYDIDDIKNIFKPYFTILKEEYYLKIAPDFFDVHSWIKVDYKKCYLKKELTHCIVCLKMINKKGCV